VYERFSTSYPMYFYPDNIQESIIIFQKGKFNYGYVKKLNSEILESSKINTEEYQGNKWYLTVWDITNVLPLSGRLEEGIAAFPEEIPRRLIKLYTFAGETVLDPFLGSGTTTKVAKELGRNSYGYEIDLELKEVIMQKIGYGQTTLTEDRIEIMERDDARRLRTFLQEEVRKQRSVTKREVKEPISIPVLVEKPTHQPDLLAKEKRVPRKEARSGWAKLKIALPNVEAVEKRIEEAKKKGVSAGYLRTLERLKRHWETNS